MLITSCIARVVHSPEERTRSSGLAVAAVALACGLGVLLRLVQYSANTALWLDEIALVKAILEADLWSLIARPLPFDLVAPKGFLAVQKLMVLTLGPSDYALRLFPFLCAVGSVLVFASLARRVLPKHGALAATVLFATSAPLVAFSGLVKQYSADVLAAVTLTWLAVGLLTRVSVSRRWPWAAFTGAVVLWISQPAVLVAAALAPLLLWQLLHGEPGRRSYLGWVVAVWIASAAMVTICSFASVTGSSREYMLTFWEDGFPPLSAMRALEVAWPWPNIQRLFAGGADAQAGMGYPFPRLYAVLAGAGYVVLWYRQKELALALVGPAALTLAAAIARQYPFSDRLILFLVPSLLLAIGAAIDLLFRLAARASARVGALAAGAVVLGAVAPVAFTPPPYRIEDVKSVLAQIQSRRLPGDPTYVYYAAAPVVSVYASTFGFNRNDVFFGGCHRADSRRYLEELDTFRGSSRLWVIVTHSLPLYREREDMLAYLDAIGTRIDEIRVASRAVRRTPAPAEAYLYDLGGTPHLPGADASTFKLTGSSVLNPRLGCFNGPLAMIPSDFQCGGPTNKRCTRRPRERR